MAESPSKREISIRLSTPSYDFKNSLERAILRLDSEFCRLELISSEKGQYEWILSVTDWRSIYGSLKKEDVLHYLEQRLGNTTNYELQLKASSISVHE